MPVVLGSMEGSRGCLAFRVFGRGILELPYRQLIPAGDRLEASFCHVMGDMAPRNEVIFRGIAPSGDTIQHTTWGFFYSWNRGGSGSSNLVPPKRSTCILASLYQ